MYSVFTLEVVMDGYKEDSSRRNLPSTLVAKATSIKISRERNADPRTQQFLAMFVPHSMVEASLRRTIFDIKAGKKSMATAASTMNSKCLWLEQADRQRLSKDLLPRIHPIFVAKASNNGSSNNTTSASSSSLFMSILQPQSQFQQQAQQQQQQQSSNNQMVMIRAIFSTTNSAQQSPADVVLLDIPLPANSRKQLINPMELLKATNGDSITEEPDAILKLLIISQVHIASSPMNLLASDSSLEVPSCPVCLHRIDPVRLGLPKPLNQHLCSKFCTSSLTDEPATRTYPSPLSTTRTPMAGCPKQRFLRPWPEPSHCIACRVIHDYQTVGAAAHSSVYCNMCALPRTLWVCLTCGFCGCGRYSNKHAEAHFLESGHNYSLELATLRIWDYANGGEFAHRADLLECPAGKQQRARALQLQQQMIASLPSTSAAAVSHGGSDTLDRWDQEQPYYWGDHGDEKSPKKAIMIGEEYEALLQSALEDQAQHYQGEISRLRAALAAEQIDKASLTEDEMSIIETLKSEIGNLREELDGVGNELLDVQAQEAGHRADSQRLLREQQVAQKLLRKIEDETRREQEQAKLQVEELEQQIADLTANLQMRHQFSQDQELSNAHIFGTVTSPDNSKTSNKRGKLRRLFRK